jgi:hypothetical protein
LAAHETTYDNTDPGSDTAANDRDALNPTNKGTFTCPNKYGGYMVAHQAA